MGYRMTTTAENEVILSWINNEYCVDIESVEELLSQDYDDLSEMMWNCAFGLDILLHYDNNHIYIEDHEIL